MDATVFPSPGNFPYYSTVDQIYHAEWSIPKLARLELLRASIRALWPQGHPTRLIHVAGTGGKGSTCRFLEMGFGAFARAGSFMSPHLFDYRERFSIGGQFVGQEDVHTAWQEVVQPHCVQMALANPHHVHTFHEVSILIALTLFDRHGVEWAAIETGVGGRYDQTRALDVAATVLTNIGGDHAHLLGSALWQRVLDKAGIARPGVPFFTTETDPASLEIIGTVCAEAGAPLTIVGQDAVAALEQRLARSGLTPIPDDSLLHAVYQRWNASVALAVIEHFQGTEHAPAVLAQFVAARLPGRFWQVEEGIYADIAHNVEKMRALAGEVAARFPDQGKVLVIGISGHRLPGEVFHAMARIAKTIIITSASYKGQDPAAVRAAIEGLTTDTPVLVIADPQQALMVAKSLRGEGDIILLTGSTYMIEQVLNPDPYLRHLSSSFGWRTRQHNEATGTVQLTLPQAPVGPR